MRKLVGAVDVASIALLLAGCQDPITKACPRIEGQWLITKIEVSDGQTTVSLAQQGILVVEHGRTP